MKMKRIGPKMSEALELIAAAPGSTKMAIARTVGPHGSLRYGYEIVDRCIAAGLVTAQYSNNKYSLTLAK
jgi:hypothetical protein